MKIVDTIVSLEYYILAVAKSGSERTLKIEQTGFEAN